MSKQTKRDDKSEFNENRRNLLKGLTTAAVAGAVISGTAHAATNTELVDVKPDDEKKTVIAKPSMLKTITTHSRSKA